MKQSVKAACILLMPILLAACGQAAPSPAVTVMPVQTGTPIPSVTPSPFPIMIAFPTPVARDTSEPAVSPGCTMVNDKKQLYLLSDWEFRDLWSHNRQIDQALAKYHPEWAAYQQVVTWDTEPVKLSEIINSASLDNELNLQINSQVALVTLGMDLNWQLPENSDLYAKSREISLKLNGIASNWERPGSESLHAQYPEIANAATYAFYIYYDQDMDRLKSWCNTYQTLFQTGP